jgi:hypothetical protein
MKTRTIRLMSSPRGDEPGVFAVTDDKKTTHYLFREIPCDIGGRGFVVHRVGLGPLYHVRVGEPRQCSCECLGFLSKGKCKHINGLLAIVGHGLV